jgi:hypothetical protein
VKNGKSDKSRSHRQETVANHTSPSPLFSVRTPTAVVTDLGTEFGVEVGRQGDMLSHVFRGKVKVQPTDGNRPVGRETTLTENGSFRVVRNRAGVAGAVEASLKTDSAKFVRSLGRRSPIASHARLLSEYNFEGDTKNSVRGAPNGAVRGHNNTNPSALFVPGKIGSLAVELGNAGKYIDVGVNGYPNCSAGLQTGTYSFWINSTHLSSREFVTHTTNGPAAFCTAFNVRLNHDATASGSDVTPGAISIQLRATDTHRREFTVTTATSNPSRLWADPASNNGWHLITLVWNVCTKAGSPGGTGPSTSTASPSPLPCPATKSTATSPSPAAIPTRW